MDQALDRLPPHNYEAEHSVIGSLLLDRDAIIKVASKLDPEDFYSTANGLIYEVIFDLYNRREPADLVTVASELSSRGVLDDVGGEAQLANIMSGVYTSVHVEFYADIVKREATRRRLIGAGTKIVGLGYQTDLDVRDALDQSESALHAVAQVRGTRDFRTMAEVLENLFETLLDGDQASKQGIPSGYLDLDQLTGGFQRSDLVVLAARPSMGKSALALGIAYGAAVRNHKKVGIFTLEMSAEQMVMRILSTETGINAHDLRLGHIPPNKMPNLSHAFGRLSEAPIYIDDSSGLTIMDVRSKARRLQSEQGLDLIIIDYLQLMQGRRQDSRVNEISEISRGLKGLARELNVPVIALSQLSRAVEQRSGHRPMLSDLRESGAIEQDADVVMFIYREDRYTDQPANPGLAEIIVAKHRNGPVGDVKLHFEPKFAKFSDLATFEFGDQ